MKPNAGLLPLETTRARPGVYLADPRDLEGQPSSEYRRLLQVSRAGELFGRKYWEWDFIASSAENLGLLRGDVSALGLGCGREQLIYYFARSCGSVIATDIYGEDTIWDVAAMRQEGDFHRFRLFEYRREVTKFVSADMRTIPYPAASQDFIWSTSSIEHVDTLADCYRVAGEIARLLKPGGYAILTTEFALSPSPYLLPNVNALTEEILQALYTNNPAFEIAGPYDLSHTWGHPAVVPMPRREIHFQRSRSIFAASQGRDYRLVVGHSLLTPIGFVVRRTDAAYPSAEELGLSPIMQRLMRLTDQAKRSPSKETLAGLVELMELEEREVPLQLKMNLAVYASQLVFLTEPSVAFVRRFADLCLSMVPNGVVQDADFLDHVAHVLRHQGRFAEACSVLEKALPSPAAFYTHVLSLAARHLLYSSQIGRVSQSIELIQPYVREFLTRGVKREEVLSTFAKECNIPTEQADALLQRFLGEQRAGDRSIDQPHGGSGK